MKRTGSQAIWEALVGDGFARASGKVGVAIATSGPGATKLVTGIATAMMDSSPMVCITGQVSSAVLGTDAFQETDITGVTLPITKHNYLVRRAEEIYPTLREAFHLARSGRPGPVLVDITKDAQQAATELDGKSQIPVALTLLGLGAFPASHPLSLGMMGMHGEAWVNQLVQEADLLIAFGMRFD